MNVQEKQLIAQRYLAEGSPTYVGDAELWDATDLQLERPVTIQLLDEKSSADEAVCETFLRHQRVAFSIQDQALLAVYDINIWEGHAFSVMQRLSGTPAAQFHSPGKPADVPLALIITRQAAEALDKCRQAQLTDWAFSPEAVQVDAEGNARLAIIEGLAPSAEAGDGDAAALSRLLRLLLTGNEEATPTDLRASSVPETVVALLDEMASDLGANVLSAGHVAARIASIEAASLEPTQSYGPNHVAPAIASDPNDPPGTPARLDSSEAPTLVAPVLLPPHGDRPVIGDEPARSAPGATAFVAAPVSDPGRATISFAAYSSPRSEASVATTERRRVPWLLPVCVALLLLLLGFAGVRLLGQKGTGPGAPTVTQAASAQTAQNKVAVPNLLGKTLDDARNTAGTAGLSIAQANPGYSTTFPTGQIVSQQPSPGEQILAGSLITVSLSLGQAPAPTVVSNPPTQPPAAKPPPKPAPKPAPANPPPHGKDKGKDPHK